ncbi:hypothetical protein OF83DRAFT_1183057 [Amylostereum chailletii]|nr:hypothetical protein OF83DRAFT_1183057 [Amylostereum chailletii]
MLNPPSWNHSINRSSSHSTSKPSTPTATLPSLGLEKTPSLSITYTPLSSSAKSTPGKSMVSTAAFTSGAGTTVTPQGAATASSSAQDPPGSQGLLPHHSPLRLSPHRGGLFLDTTIASESSPCATTPDFPLGFTRGANPGEYYALTLGGRRTIHWTRASWCPGPTPASAQVSGTGYTRRRVPKPAWIRVLKVPTVPEIDDVNPMFFLTI